MGENGAGKTTLLKILLGELEPVKGWRKANRNLCIGYFSQHHVDQLDMSMTSIELMAERYPGKTVLKVGTGMCTCTLLIHTFTRIRIKINVKYLLPSYLNNHH